MSKITCRKIIQFLLGISILSLMIYKIFDWCYNIGDNNTRKTDSSSSFNNLKRTTTSNEEFSTTQGENLKSQISVISGVNRDNHNRNVNNIPLPRNLPIMMTNNDNNYDGNNGASGSNGRMHSTTGHVYLTLCNLNRIKISKLYMVNKGINLYDEIIDEMQTYDQQSGEKQTDMWRKKLSDLSINYHHNISDMLKICEIDGVKCSSKDFIKVPTDLGVCHAITLILLHKQKIKVKLKLDPEENEYLLADQGYHGFTVFLTDNLTYAQADNPNQFFISLQLESIVRVERRSRQDQTKNPCPTEYYQNESCNRFKITLLSQVLTSSLYSKLMRYSMALADTSSKSSESEHYMERLQHLQQRSIIRQANRTAFDSLIKISASLLHSHKMNKATWNIVRRLQTNLTLIERTKKTLGKMNDSREKCLQPVVRILSQAQEVFTEAADNWQEWILRHSDNPLVYVNPNQLQIELYLSSVFFYAKNFVSPENIFHKINLKIKSLLEEKAMKNANHSKDYCQETSLEVNFWLEQLHYYSGEAKAILNTIEKEMINFILDNSQLRLAVSPKFIDKTNLPFLASTTIELIDVDCFSPTAVQLEQHVFHSPYKQTGELISILIEGLTIILLIIILFDNNGPIRNKESINLSSFLRDRQPNVPITATSTAPNKIIQLVNNNEHVDQIPHGMDLSQTYFRPSSDLVFDYYPMTNSNNETILIPKSIRKHPQVCSKPNNAMNEEYISSRSFNSVGASLSNDFIRRNGSVAIKETLHKFQHSTSESHLDMLNPTQDNVNTFNNENSHGIVNTRTLPYELTSTNQMSII